MTPEVNKQLATYSTTDDSGHQGWGGQTTDKIAISVGCTAITALITPTEIYIANAGDSWAVACDSKQKAIELSRDHKPDNPEEKARIEAAGGFVEDNRVKGILNLSRSLGDMEYKQDTSLPATKQMLLAFPEVKTIKWDDVDFLILACDGIWDCMSNLEAVDFVLEERAKRGKDLKLSTIVGNMFEKNIAEEIHTSSKFFWPFRRNWMR